MSLILSTQINSATPILISDVAISNDSELDTRRAVLPSIGSITNFYEEDGWTITALQQKMAIIDESLVLAWAGSPIGGGIIVDYLKAAFREGPVSAASVNAYLRSCADQEVKDSQFLGWKAEANGGFSAICSQNSEAVYGGRTTYLGGTGDMSVRQILRAKRGWNSQPSQGPRYQVSLACNEAMMMVSSLIRSEQADGYPLLHYFGGAYEIAYFDGRRFRKRGNITYAVWDAEVWLDSLSGRSRCSFSHPFLVLTQHYYGTRLVLKAFRFPEGSTREVSSIERVFTVMRSAGTGNLDSAIIPVPSDVPAIGAQICNIFRVRFKTQMGFYASVQLSTAPGLVWREEDGAMTISVDPRFVNTVGSIMAEGATGRSGLSRNIPLGTRTEWLSPYLIYE